MEHRNYNKQVAFVAASLIQLADISETDLEELVEFVGVDTISELIARDALWSDLTYQAMAEGICNRIGWEPPLVFPIRCDAELYRLGRLIALAVSAAETEGSTEAERLFSVIRSGDINWIFFYDVLEDIEWKYPLF